MSNPLDLDRLFHEGKGRLPGADALIGPPTPPLHRSRVLRVMFQLFNTTPCDLCQPMLPVTAHDDAVVPRTCHPCTGDDQTWAIDDWSWDPYQLLAEPRAGSPGTGICTQPTAKRARLQERGQRGDGRRGGTLGTTAGCHAASALAGALQPQQLQLPLPQQLVGVGEGCEAPLLPSSFQVLLAEGGGDASSSLAAAAWGGVGVPTPGGVGGAQQVPPTIATGVAACSGGAAPHACQALAYGLPFLQAGSEVVGAGVPVGGCSGVVLHGTHHRGSGAGAAAGPDCSSVADSGSEGTAQHMAAAQLAAAMACAPHPAHATGAPCAIVPAECVASPSSMASAGGHGCAAGPAGGEDNGGEDGGDNDDHGRLLVCQVPGCGRDLAGLKEYHQRYRICDTHIKLPQVAKDGRLQRFCQQARHKAKGTAPAFVVYMIKSAVPGHVLYVPPAAVFDLNLPCMLRAASRPRLCGNRSAAASMTWLPLMATARAAGSSCRSTMRAAAAGTTNLTLPTFHSPLPLLSSQCLQCLLPMPLPSMMPCAH
jgi:SBP domain